MSSFPSGGRVPCGLTPWFVRVTVDVARYGYWVLVDVNYFVSVLVKWDS